MLARHWRGIDTEIQTVVQEERNMITADNKKGFASRVLALLVAVATALGLAVVSGPAAHADTRGVLRPGCHWDPEYKYFVQNCWVPSPSMGGPILTQIKASSRGGNAGVYLLDGLRAPENYSGWTWDGNAPHHFVDDNVTLVMPVGGAAQFYADWDGPFLGPRGPKAPKWETFLTRELPGYLQAHFGVSPNNNAIVGLSMGALGALNLAGRHRDQFKQVTSLSGYMNPTGPGMLQALQAAVISEAGPLVWLDQMWGPVGSAKSFELDPFVNAKNFAGMPMYLSSMNGIPTLEDLQRADPLGILSGAGLEAISFLETVKFETAVRGAGANVTTSYPVFGIHNWATWSQEIGKARPQILAALGA